MKILIGCDGSGYMEIIRADLREAGLPKEAEILILSVADVWLPEPWMPGIEAGMEVSLSAAVHEAVMRSGDMAKEAVENAEGWAKEFANTLAQDFPDWKIRTEACAASPASAILDRAKAWQADLIVTGARGSSELERLLLGSVSSQVLAEATCSVRISRPHRHKSTEGQRILIGVDGSDTALLTVKAVARRQWDAKTEACLVVAIDDSLTTAPRTLFSLFDNDNSAREEAELEARIEALLEQEEERLAIAGIKATSIVTSGNPGYALMKEAEDWQADTIFVGAQGIRGHESSRLGRVARAVAERSPISVEIVRE